MNYISKHPTESLSLTQICNLSGASKRTLEYGFQERFLVGPINFMKYIKLNNVRKDIIGYTNKPIVSEIAKKYGFTHGTIFGRLQRIVWGASK